MGRYWGYAARVSDFQPFMSEIRRAPDTLDDNCSRPKYNSVYM